MMPFCYSTARYPQRRNKFPIGYTPSPSNVSGTIISGLYGAIGLSAAAFNYYSLDPILFYELYKS
jgi:hypothetical protein